MILGTVKPVIIVDLAIGKKVPVMSVLKILMIFFVLLLPLSTSAEQKKTMGNWDVHYIVLNTTFLEPKVAKAYDLVRSRNNALVNISVLNRRSKEAQSVSMTGTASNLLGRKSSLEFRKIEEGDSIYYLAVLPFDDEELYRFDIKIVAGNNNQRLKFQQKLYKD
jgi:hypothetical protein